MDDLLDLDWGGTSKSKQPPLTLAQQQAQTAAGAQYTQATQHSGNGKLGASSTYNFDALTRSMPSASGSLYAPSSRSGTPSNTTPLKPQATPINGSSTSAAGTASFADLVNFGTTARTVSGSMNAQQGPGGGGQGSKMTGMSMLDRVKAEANRGASAQSADTGLWDFDAFGSASTPSPAPPTPARAAPPSVSVQSASRGQAVNASTSPTSRSQAARQTPGLFSLLDGEDDHFAEEAPPLPKRSDSRQASKVNAVKDPFDLDSFDDVAPSSLPAASLASFSQAALPNVSMGDSAFDDEDDFLGALGKPVEPKPARTPSPPARRHDKLRAEASSPGTRGSGSSTSSRGPSPADGGRERYNQRAKERPRSPPASYVDEERAARERDEAILGGSPPSSGRRQREGGPSFVAAAALFGTNLEENLLGALGRTFGFSGTRSNPSKSATNTPPPSSAPRRREPEQEQGGVGDGTSTPGTTSTSSRAPSPAAGGRNRYQARKTVQSVPSPAEPTRNPPSTAAEASAPSRPDRARVRPSTQAAPSTPSRPEPIRVPRSIVADSSSAITAAAALKSQGNEAFKRGAYGEAETHYTKALDHLEDGSLRKISLLNNRAQSRLKNGEASGASRDCEALLAIIVPPTKATAGSNATTLYRPREEAALPEPLRSEVNLRDAWAKAVLRRAQASEMLERWVSARRDWDALLRFEKEEGSGKAGVSNMRSAKEGLARCEEMISGKKQKKSSEQQQASRSSGREGRSNGSGDRAAAAATARQSASTAAAIARAGEAGVERVRQEAAAQADEEAAKLSLKDQVDAAVNGWKDGKESNVRGLLASVETIVVWPEFGWKKIGLHELITDVQVKKAYTRAIARLHPDKLSNKSTTLEQRMVAAAVFATLNEAFTAAQS
ncbi:hypothetical protein CF326_g3701 [Tilletia indica]|nr:hypothetical protein CF326_g3701 [Tilletia indica]